LRIGSGGAVQGEKNRYFIELQQEGEPVPRHREAEIRRQQATQFVAMIHEWLKEKELENKVSDMAITALGQVQITCEADIIGMIRREEEDNIAAIRQASAYIGHIGRW
jgi:hypothetical protein